VADDLFQALADPTRRTILDELAEKSGRDLRGAQAAGMRSAYVHRPVGDPPTGSDDFDGRFDELG
jgi:DNA-binding transcriptional ArsR family regulator